MSAAAKKYITVLFVLVVAGTFIGWWYGRPMVGCLVVVSALLIFHVWQSLLFDQAMRDDLVDVFQQGEGFWAQLYSRLRFERTRAQKRKVRYRQLLREIRHSTDAMPDGAVILNEGLEMVACNRAAKRLTGLKRTRDRGQHIDYILRDPKLAALLKSKDQQAAIEIRSPVDDNRWLNCRIVPYGARQKLLLLRDVTERRHLSKIRRDFVANASHELRSPLTVITGYLDSFIDDQDLPNDWHRPLRQMQKQSKRMTHILNELLELSRLDGAAKASSENPIDIKVMLQSVVEDFVTPDVTVAIRVHANDEVQLLGVHSEIESVVVNLLSNAIRHTSADGEVDIQWRRVDEGAELVVSDNGEGINADDVPRLTERFFRVDRGRSRDQGGTGLGLAIVKHVLLRHDALLEVESARGKGSQFTCRFPVARVVTKM